MELRRLHIVRVAAESVESPARVDRIGRGVAPAAEITEMRVGNAGRTERRGERIAAELRVPARAGETADVDQRRDAVRREQR
jgi:hypothetical protein